MLPDFQCLERIRDYRDEIQKTVARYGQSFETFDVDANYQRSVVFCILQIGRLVGGLSEEYRQKTVSRIQWGLSRA